MKGRDFRDMVASVFEMDYNVGRPVRDTVIGKDDQLNLKIALETAKSFEEFLELV